MSTINRSMVAVLDFCGGLPSVFIYNSRWKIHTDDISGLIIAHKYDNGALHGEDFICEDEREAFGRLSLIVRAEYPGIEVIDKVNN